MLKKILIFSFLVLAIIGEFNVTPAENLKGPNVSGSFYPASKEELMAMVDTFLEKAKPGAVNGKVTALISPHAGYLYSGQVAAYGYKALKYENFDTVIIIGPSHYMYLDGFSIYPKGSFLTPLGKVDIDEKLAKKIMSKSKRISFMPEAFEKEHSLEVQLPFLQRILVDFDIVPIITGNLNYKDCQILANAITSSLDNNKKKVLLIASSDFSHYHSYRQAVAMDMMAIKDVEKMQPRYVFNKIKEGKIEMCGAQAVITIMIASEQMGTDSAMLLKYANSGDIIFDKSRVVGYASMVFFISDKKKKENNMLNESQRKKLFKIARKAIENYVKTGQKIELSETDKELLEEKGAFVTIHKGENLRGCIGNIIGHGPLYLTVRDMAIAAAADDPRFSPLSPDELDEIDIEISVLSKPRRITDVGEIQLGTHGVIIKKGFRSGVFLPQVATETGWSKEEFLSNLCAHKAGLSAEAWKDEDTEIYIFSAEVFGEE